MWVSEKALEIEYPPLVTAVLMQRGQMGHPMSCIRPWTVESAIIAIGEEKITRAEEWLRLTRGECLLCCSIAPVTPDFDKTDALVRDLRGRLYDRKKRVLSSMIVPEPRRNEHAHLNIVLRIQTKDAINLANMYEARFKEFGDIFKIWTDPDTGEFIYSYEQQCVDDNINRTPGPIWYSLKSTTTWARIRSHNIVAELRRRPTREESVSALESKIWRKTFQYSITFSHKRKESSPQKSTTSTYRKQQTPSRGFLPQALSNAILNLRSQRNRK